MLPFFIFLGVVTVGIIFGLIIHELIKKRKLKQIEYVKQYSVALAALNEINSKYHFNNPKQRELFFDISLRSKKVFDNFDYVSAIRNTFFENRDRIQSFMDKVTKDKMLLKQYNSEIKKLPSTDFSSLPAVKYIKLPTFSKLEELFVSRKILKISTNFSVKIHWYYESPAGRNYYENQRTFNYDKIVQLFLTYFNYDLRDVEENERKLKAIDSVIKELTKPVYNFDEVVNSFEKYDYKAENSVVEATLFNAGYVRRKDSDFYIHSSVKNIRDLILASADDDGLITYENKIKDEEYDNAIDKLEKEGRIVPIDNLHFLKIFKNLNYKGITLEAIDEFDSLLLKYSRNETFVSVKMVLDNIDCALTKVDFEECFVSTIMKYCGFLYPVPGIEKLYTIIQKPQRILFLEWLLKGKKSVDAFDLIYDLKELYGIEYNIYSIIYDLGKYKTDLYYNPDMEKLYSNKEFFFEELEDVL